MPRQPLAVSLMLAFTLLTAAACSSSGDTPKSGDKSSSDSTKSPSTKLKKETGKGDIKNVYAKTSTGSKISLSAAAPGHEVMEQIYDPKAKTWSAPTSVFKDDARFCHSIKLKASGTIVAATVACSISAKDTGGTQSSYVLASTDGKTWKRSDLIGASAKPSVSPNGKFVSFMSPTGFLLWDAAGTFTTVKYAQDTASPTVGVTQDDGSVLMVKAVGQKKGFCVISFLTASAKALTPKPINSTLPQADDPHCVIVDAKMQDADLIADFTSTTVTKVDGKKSTKKTPFAISFKLVDARWLVKAA